jgi:predicted alpha/beta superfamily hydrolase
MPVVYATDGNWTFDLFKSLSYLLQMAAEDAPPYILVGIGYPGDTPHAGSRLRGRDFTAPPYPNYDRDAVAPRYEGTLMPQPGTRTFHGGADFRTFMCEELIPFIDQTYDTILGDRTYFGHSGGGYFGLFTLFTQPEAFRNYIVSSPGLIYHGELPDGSVRDNDDFAMRLAREFIASGKSLDGIKLYLSAGAEEEFEPALLGWQLTSGVYRMAKLLRDAEIPGLELMTEIFPAETHITSWPIAFCHGIQAVFGTRRIVGSVYF